MQFSEILDTVERVGDDWQAQVSEDWLQGRSAFGGLQAALAWRAMRALAPAEWPLRTLQTTFVAPVPVGLLRIGARILRTGKSALQIEARLLDGEQTLCLLVGVFGAARASTIQLAPTQPAIDAATPRTLPFIPGVVPNFTQHFQANWLRGELPFSGGKSLEQVIDLSLRDAGRVDEGHVLAMADFIPPIALSMFRTPVAGSSLSWMVELLRDRYDDLGVQHWRLDAQLLAARDGYTEQNVMLWGPRGEPVALSRQSMVVFG